MAGTVRDGAKADDLREVADRAGVRCRTAVLDVTEEGACRDLVERASPWAWTVRGELRADRPRDRYPVGVDAQVLSRVARFVPVPVTDAATRLLLDLR